MPLSDKQRQEYLSHPYTCPYCKSDNIRADHFEPEASFQAVTCEDCGKEWRDIYKLVDIEEE